VNKKVKLRIKPVIFSWPSLPVLVRLNSQKGIRPIEDTASTILEPEDPADVEPLWKVGCLNNKHRMGREAQLAWKCLFMSTFLGGWFWPSGRSDLPKFGVLSVSGLISRSVQARLQVSVCSSYDLCHPGYHPDRQMAFWPVYMNSWACWAKKIRVAVSALTE